MMHSCDSCRCSCCIMAGSECACVGLMPDCFFSSAQSHRLGCVLVCCTMAEG